MILNINDCKRCEISRSRNKIVIPQLQKPKYSGMIISECPTKKEDRSGQFDDLYWKELDVIFQNFGYNLDVFYRTAIIKCYPGCNRYPLHQEIENCSHYFAQELVDIQPKAILFLSEQCAKEYIKDEKVVVNKRYETKFCKNVIVTYNPRSLIAGTDSYITFKSVVRKFISYCIA